MSLYGIKKLINGFKLLIELDWLVNILCAVCADLNIYSQKKQLKKLQHRKKDKNAPSFSHAIAQRRQDVRRAAQGGGGCVQL
jgi:hypothetical protein